MKRKSPAITLAVLLVASAMGGVVVGAGTVSAQEDCSFVSDLIGDCEGDGSVISDAMNYASGIVGHYTYDAKYDTASESAQAFQETFNANSDSLVAYTNGRLNASDSRDVVRITFEREDTEETVYLVTTHTNGDYQTAEVVDSTDKQIDYFLELEGVAADDAATQLETFNDDYASQDQAPPRSYISSLAGQYRGDVSGNLIDELRGE